MPLNRTSLPTGFRPQDTLKRKETIKAYTGIDIGIDEKNTPEELQGIIENHVGFLNVPIGIASPLLLKGKYAHGTFYVPACTVEGSLVASMNRGMLATSRCGGVTTNHIRQEVSRAPVFIFHTVAEIDRFLLWVEKHFKEIKKAAETSTRFGVLQRIDKYVLQNSVVLDFVYTTGNAAGQNMVSLATYVGAEHIKKQYGVSYVLDSNFASDKKASYINDIRGRGHYVIAETTISHDILKKILKVTKEDLRFMQEFFPYASKMAGIHGIQLHIANALAAIYLATGQDTACVAENALGYTQMTEVKDGIKFMLTMPSLTVGTVGGGTRLKNQQTHLKLLGCHKGKDSSKKLAEIICASALCLEISLWCAIGSETWVKAHMKYGRTKSRTNKNDEVK